MVCWMLQPPLSREVLLRSPAFDPATDHYQGDPKAKNVFIEYGDLECPACAAYSPILKGVPTTFPDTVFVFRFFPLVQIHPNSVEAALAAEAANAQGDFWQLHDILFQNQSAWESLSRPFNRFCPIRPASRSKRYYPVPKRYYFSQIFIRN